MSLTRETTNPLEVRIYHICHFDNLASIVAGGELCPLNVLKTRGITPRSIAYSHLQTRRDTLEILLPPGGNLHDYIPWGFAARSPMLYTTARGALSIGTSQHDVVHFVSNVAKVQALKLSFVFTDGHPLTTAFTKFSSELEQLPAFLDWSVLLDRWWKNSFDDLDRKRRRQAEFLIHGSAPWRLVVGIAVANEEMQRKVTQIVQKSSHQPKVLTLPEWYY